MGDLSTLSFRLSAKEEETAATMKQYQQQGPAEEAPMGSLGEMLKQQLEKKARQGK